MMCLCVKILNCSNTPVRTSLNTAFSSQLGLGTQLVTDRTQMVPGNVRLRPDCGSAIGSSVAVQSSRPWLSRNSPTTWLIIYLSR